MPSERRAHPRLREEHAVEAKILSSPERPELEQMRFACTTEDISASGLRLVLPVALSVGSAIEIQLVTEQPRRTFWHVGRVVWTRPRNGKGDSHMVGIRFTETPEETLHLWEDLLLEKLARRGASTHGTV
ncbi:MAG: PilZ domain-containing protein [Kiritimatiellae bacterium]|nr:PilZ domain-containing protein [Kiritimatiellia bacterium]